MTVLKPLHVHLYLYCIYTVHNCIYTVFILCITLEKGFIHIIIRIEVYHTKGFQTVEEN